MKCRAPNSAFRDERGTFRRRKMKFRRRNFILPSRKMEFRRRKIAGRRRNAASFRRNTVSFSEVEAAGAAVGVAASRFAAGATGLVIKWFADITARERDFGLRELLAEGHPGGRVRLVGQRGGGGRWGRLGHHRPTEGQARQAGARGAAAARSAKCHVRADRRAASRE